MLMTDFVVEVHDQQAARCPACGKLSQSQHSAYVRRLKDLPWQGFCSRGCA